MHLGAPRHGGPRLDARLGTKGVDFKRGGAPLVVERRVAGDDGLAVEGVEAVGRALDEHVEEEAQDEVRHAQQSGQAVEEKLAERLGLARAVPDAADAACGPGASRGAPRGAGARTVVPVPEEDGRVAPPGEGVLEGVALGPRLGHVDHLVLRRHLDVPHGGGTRFFRGGLPFLQKF